MSTVAEREREARIAANKAKLAELGINETVEAVLATKPQKPKPAERKRKAARGESADADGGEVRRSARPRAEVSYVYKEERGEGGGREPVDYTEKIKQLQLDAEEAEKLRLELEAKKNGGDAAGGEGGKKKKERGGNRGPKDSGKGVRVQGGRVYDSKFGVTCHWCRQKTLEAHVTCTHPNCAKGKMPFSFCHKCLKNRHGEDAEEAAESGCWVCPACRGSCGPGCVLCCNCGPCRKKAGLEPTAQIVFLARSAGFGNVHDYLVHLVTGEPEEAIAARKAKAPWGGFARGETASDASAQTAAAAAGDDEQPEEEAEEQAGSGRKRGRGAKKAQRGGSGGGSGNKGSSSSTPAPAPKGRRASKASAAAAETPAADETPAAAPPSSARGRGKKAAAKGDGAPAADADGGAKAAAAAKAQQGGASPKDAAPAGDQDAKLSRKARMMQRMGLAPRGEVLAA